MCTIRQKGGVILDGVQKLVIRVAYGQINRSQSRRLKDPKLYSIEERRFTTGLVETLGILRGSFKINHDCIFRQVIEDKRRQTGTKRRQANSRLNVCAKLCCHRFGPRYPQTSYLIGTQMYLKYH